MQTLPSKRSKGVVLIAFAVSMVVIMGMLGFAVDLGRMYIVRNEAQSFADAAALAAATCLNGTPAGATAANVAVSGQYGLTNALWGRYHFDNNSFNSGPGTLTVRFARNNTGPWVDLATVTTDATGYRFVEVIPTVPVSMYVSQVLTGSGTRNVMARGVAGQVKITAMDEGMAPFAPLAHCGPGLVPSTCTPGGDVGYVDGNIYTLRWGSNAFTQLQGDTAPMFPSTNNWCQNDNNTYAPDYVNYLYNLALSMGSNIKSWDGRGFIDMGTGPSAAAMADLIFNGYMDKPFYVGEGGSEYDLLQKIANAVGKALNDKAAATDPADRMIAVPVVDPSTGQIIDFRAFELIPNSYKAPGVEPWCAIYRGGAQKNSGKETVLQDGIYEIRLVP
jgi:Flp pilus assembly protein TadG